MELERDINQHLSNHVFLLCDSDGNPNLISGQGFYLVLHENRNANLLVGSNITLATRAGPQKNGRWETDEVGYIYVYWEDAENVSGPWVGIESSRGDNWDLYHKETGGIAKNVMDF